MDHLEQVLGLLHKQIKNSAEVEEIKLAAEAVSDKWVDPLSGGSESTNGLLYGLVQSGKTGVLTTTGAIGADKGYKTIIVLTSDIDPLYDQTLGRVREAFPGMDVLGKADISDINSFVKRLRVGVCAIVMTKNATRLATLVENFRQGRIRGLSCLIIDDEADQASLNTRQSKQDGTRSQINASITELRGFFEKNTYLQVTATPQALFLQTPDHDFRPKFTVLSHPGADYVGGDDFFGGGANLVREFPLNDIAVITPATQPNPSLQIPPSLVTALDTFMLGATYKRMKDATQNCAFLCHVSTRNPHHKHIENLLRSYKFDLTEQAKNSDSALIRRFQAAYSDIEGTYPQIKEIGLDELIRNIAFFSPGIAVKLVNGQTDEDVAVHSPYNLFVGGNKLGRGVTIKNLLVSYYGRNPRTPQADTVLQHARMYGYRRSDIGLLRLFLPNQLHRVFQAINRMERGLRDLIAQSPSEDFRGIYVEGALAPTRRNVLVPGAVGVYSGGAIYNPAQIMRDVKSLDRTKQIDDLLESIVNDQYEEMPLHFVKQLIELIIPDDSEAEQIWDNLAIAESVMQFGNLQNQHTGYVYVDRDRGLKEKRRETQGILDGGESRRVPDDRLTLFMLRTRKFSSSQNEAWWPQIRFPRGRYAFAFAI